MPSTATPRGLEGIVKRIVPSAESSTGPVKTSPEGMLRRPSEFTHVRPPTRSPRAVASASMPHSLAPPRPQVRALGLDAQLLGAPEAVDQPCLPRAQLAPRRLGVLAVEEQGTF